MSVSDRTRPKASAEVEVCEGVPAAIAVLREGGSLEHATRAFVDGFEVHDGALASFPHEAEQVLAGEDDHLTTTIEGRDADLVAVLDRHGRRMAALTIRAAPDDSGSDSASPLLDEPLDESPAIVWLKDLDGRYLRVNRRYTEQLATDAEAVCGRTDAELTAAGSIEGLRLEEQDSAGRDPLELEYRIGAFEERPAFAALRFALRDGDGAPTATCSVAAPLSEAALARSECERLMRIDRWARLDPFAIRQELLDEWGLTLADGSSGPPLDRDERVAAALLERDEALAAAARLEEELTQEREQRGSLRAESERATQRAQELDDAVAAARARSEELEQSLARAETRSSELEAELTSARAELEEHTTRAQALEAAASTPQSDRLAWTADAQRALAGALVGLTEWRSVLKQTVATLGSEGGWDAAIAWSPNDPRGLMRCGAIWVRDAAALGALETRTWQQRRDASSAELGRARKRMAATCLLELQSAEDQFLQNAATDGMGSALLVPVRDGADTIAMLELLSASASAPDPELTGSLDAIALQLSAIAQLIKLADVPRWRTGRL